MSPVDRIRENKWWDLYVKIIFAAFPLGAAWVVWATTTIQKHEYQHLTRAEFITHEKEAARAMQDISFPDVERRILSFERKLDLLTTEITNIRILLAQKEGQQ